MEAQKKRKLGYLIILILIFVIGGVALVINLSSKELGKQDFLSGKDESMADGDIEPDLNLEQVVEKNSDLDILSVQAESEISFKPPGNNRKMVFQSKPEENKNTISEQAEKIMDYKIKDDFVEIKKIEKIETEQSDISYFIEFDQDDTKTIWIKRKISENEVHDEAVKSVQSVQKDLVYEAFTNY
jgi:hypothetical protein